MAKVPGKRQTLLAYLDRGVAMLHLDARRPGVVVPPQFATDAHLRLNLSYRYGIPDLEIGLERVQATLSFGGRAFRCLLPWPAVYGITSNASGDGQVWPEDLPTEVMHTLAAEADSRKKEAAPAKARPSLSAIPGSSGPAPEREEEDLPSEDRPASRGHLRLVR